MFFCKTIKDYNHYLKVIDEYLNEENEISIGWRHYDISNIYIYVNIDNDNSIRFSYNVDYKNDNINELLCYKLKNLDYENMSIEALENFKLFFNELENLGYKYMNEFKNSDSYLKFLLKSS